MDDDKFNNTVFLYECYSTPYLDKSKFDLNPSTGVLYLKEPLNRDAPDGSSIYYLPVSVSDQGQPPLKTFTTVQINLNDINDNAPVLVHGSQQPPLIINEATTTESLEIYVVDVDDPKYGPPFTFTLDNYTDLFSLQQINCPQCTKDRARYQLVNKQPLNRTLQKYYIIPYTVSDNGGLARTGSFQLIVGDQNNLPQSDGSKQVRILGLNSQLQLNQFMGTLYVTDGDDWGQASKTSTNCVQSTGQTFTVVDGLRILGPQSFQQFPKDNMNLQCTVTDQSASTALAKVDFTLQNIEFADLLDPVGVRLVGITAEDLSKKLTLSDTSVLERLLLKMVNILSLTGQNDVLKVVTLRNQLFNQHRLRPDQIVTFDTTSFGTDVYLYVRRNGLLVSSRYVYSVLFTNLQQLLAPEFVGIILLFDTCQGKAQNFCPVNATCKQNFIASAQSLTVDANATSFVGLSNVLDAQCYCSQG